MPAKKSDVGSMLLKGGKQATGMLMDKSLWVAAALAFILAIYIALPHSLSSDNWVMLAIHVALGVWLASAVMDVMSKSDAKKKEGMKKSLLILALMVGLTLVVSYDVAGIPSSLGMSVDSRDPAYVWLPPILAAIAIYAVYVSHDGFLKIARWVFGLSGLIAILSLMGVVNMPRESALSDALLGELKPSAWHAVVLIVSAGGLALAMK